VCPVSTNKKIYLVGSVYYFSCRTGDGLLPYQTCTEKDDGKYQCRTCGKPILKGEDYAWAVPEQWDGWDTTYYHLSCLVRKCKRCSKADAYPFAVYETPGFNQRPVCDACEKEEEDRWALKEWKESNLWQFIRITIYRLYLTDELWSILGNYLSKTEWSDEAYEEKEVVEVFKLWKEVEGTSYDKVPDRDALLGVMRRLHTIYSLPKFEAAKGSTLGLANGVILGKLLGEPEAWRDLLVLLGLLIAKLEGLDEKGHQEFMRMKIKDYI
jgi:hypothetical protein